MEAEVKNLIEGVVKMASTVAPKTSADYVAEDGLIHCGNCHTAKQYRIEIFGNKSVVGVLCKCEKERQETEEAARKLREEKDRISRMKATCIHDKSLVDSTFEKDDGSLPQIASAKRYVDTWPDRKVNNDGLLLWGDVGTGKTFYAACIANALIEKGVSVLMTNFAKILNSLSGLYAEEKNEFVASLMRYSLLIIDDFGIERNTDYAIEQVYNVIDERYKSGLPLIVTTNLSLNTLKNPPDTAHQRIYDRVLSMCVPVRFAGANHRKQDAENKLKSCRDLFITD